MPSEGLLYVGSYGENNEATIHVCKLDPATGELTIVQRVQGVENASFLALHPGGERLYAVKELAEANGEAGGEVVAITIDRESGLLGEVTSSASTKGAHPCYVSVNVDGTALYTANYTGGSVSMHPLDSYGEVLPAASFIQHACAPGPVADRQEAPHAHCISPVAGTPFLHAVDLGMDAVVAYAHEPGTAKLVKVGETNMPPGSGPRHIAYHPGLEAAYVANELASTVSQLQLNRNTGELKMLHTYSTLPGDYDGYNDCADIHVSPDGRYLYVSNRGHNSIAVFAIHPAMYELTLVEHTHSGGELPRNFGISPDGKLLLAANGKSGCIAVFHRDSDSGKLTATGQVLQLNTPVCIRFAIS